MLTRMVAIVMVMLTRMVVMVMLTRMVLSATYQGMHWW